MELVRGVGESRTEQEYQRWIVELEFEVQHLESELRQRTTELDSLKAENEKLRARLVEQIEEAAKQSAESRSLTP